MKYFRIVLAGVGGYLLAVLIVMVICSIVSTIADLSIKFCNAVTLLGYLVALIAVLVAVILRIKDEKYPNEKRSNLAAGLLALLLGGLGAHKYYCRKYTLGVLYVLFCWTMLPSTIAFVEGIIYILMSEEEFNKSIKCK